MKKNYDQLLDGFIKDLEAKNRSHATIIAYRKDIEQLFSHLKGSNITQIENVTLDHLNSYKSFLEEKQYTPKSISRKINSIKTFFRFLLTDKQVADNPADDLEHPKFETQPPRVLTQMEYRALRDACRHDTRLYSIVELLLQTGIRIGELTRLTLEEINYDEDDNPKSLEIAAYGSHPSRNVPLNKSASASLKEYLESRPEGKDDTLFITKTGNPLLVRNIRTSIDRAFKKAGVKDAKVNDLRNTFIAHHLARGVSLVTVSKLVGHKRLSTTEKYLDIVNGKPKKETRLEEL